VTRSVLHVITTLNRGGAENHLADLVRLQLGDGERVSVAFLKGDGYWARPLREWGADVHDLAVRRYVNPGALLHLHRLISERQPLIVHAHLPPAEVYARVALSGRSRATCPLVVTKHNHAPFWRTAEPVGLRLGRWVARRSAATIAVSRAIADRVRREGFVSPIGDVSVIHHGLDPAPFRNVDQTAVAELRRVWGANPDTVVFGTVARLVQQKSMDTLLDAFARLRRQTDAPARLVIVGTGPLEQDLKALAGQLGVSGDCVWAGFRDDIPTLMTAFDAFVLSSAWEGLGRVLLEAMAAGRPIAASNVNGIPEVAPDGRVGVLVPPRDPIALARALAKLLSPDTRYRLGTAGARWVTQFSPERMAVATRAVYRTARASLG
jgi:glycosyltransferase involved in cell wall biosynthesis